MCKLKLFPAPCSLNFPVAVTLGKKADLYYKIQISRRRRACRLKEVIRNTLALEQVMLINDRKRVGELYLSQSKPTNVFNHSKAHRKLQYDECMEAEEERCNGANVKHKASTHVWMDGWMDNHYKNVIHTYIYE